jgi:hypothetical protein
LQYGERRPNALALVFGGQPGKHPPKCGCCTPEWTYLPSGKPEECGLDRPRLRLVDCVTAFRREVPRVGFGLGLQHAVLDGVEHGARLNGSGSGGTTQRFLFAFARIGTHENWARAASLFEHGRNDPTIDRPLDPQFAGVMLTLPGENEIAVIETHNGAPDRSNCGTFG